MSVEAQSQCAIVVHTIDPLGENYWGKLISMDDATTDVN